MRAPPSTLQSPAFRWCCTASIDLEAASPNNSAVHVNHVAGYNENGMAQGDCCSPFYTAPNGIMLDLTNSADWMESVEWSERRMEEEGGAGAYDTLRCDMLLHPKCTSNHVHFNEMRWRIWGEEFHLGRLKNSYSSLLNVNTLNFAAAERVRDEISVAMQRSRSLMRELLKEAENASILREKVNPNEVSVSSHDDEIQLIRLTLLWSPSKASSSQKFSPIIVRGHACCTASPQRVSSSVASIIVSIAATGHHQDGEGDPLVTTASIDPDLPTRHQHPQSKVASWTRMRKSLENPETYKPPGVTEVLLVRPTGHHLEILEGLSSNFFVIYNDGTIRTAQDGVLFGYVRKLVLECAETCGLTVDPRPIFMHDATEGRWKEAFITSSSRLVFPISKILIPSEHGENSFEELWRDPVLSVSWPQNPEPNEPEMKWRQILDEILLRGGYSKQATSVKTCH